MATRRASIASGSRRSRGWKRRGAAWRQLLGASPREIVFTSGGTEADNLAIFGAVRAAKRKQKHVITTAIEHAAVLAACGQLACDGVAITFLPVGASGVVDPDDVRAAIRARYGAGFGDARQ